MHTVSSFGPLTCHMYTCMHMYSCTLCVHAYVEASNYMMPRFMIRCTHMCMHVYAHICMYILVCMDIFVHTHVEAFACVVRRSIIFLVRYRARAVSVHPARTRIGLAYGPRAKMRARRICSLDSRMHIYHERKCGRWESVVRC